MMPRMSYRLNEGWYLDVEEPLPQVAVNSAIAFGIKVNMERYHALPPGDRKDELRGALKDLMAGNVKQRIIAEKNKEYTIFKGE